MGQKILLIANPFSGKCKAEKIIPIVRHELISRKVDFNLKITKAQGEATQIAREEHRKGYKSVLILGGDGTFSETINGLGKTNLPLGFICCGSGNDFGKLFFKNVSIKDQISIALSNKIKKIDVGMCNKELFINGIGAGFDGKVVEEIESKGKKLTGHAAYLLTVLKQMLFYKEPYMQIESKELNYSGPVFLVSVMNGTCMGGGFYLTPEAKVDDGWLDVCLVKPINVLGRYKNLRKVEKGIHGSLSIVEIFKTKKISISAKEYASAHRDGEYIGQSPYRIKVLPKMLKIKIP